jgi:hypothetical protein
MLRDSRQISGSVRRGRRGSQPVRPCIYGSGREPTPLRVTIRDLQRHQTAFRVADPSDGPQPLRLLSTSDCRDCATAASCLKWHHRRMLPEEGCSRFGARRCEWLRDEVIQGCQAQQSALQWRPSRSNIGEL